MKKGKHQEYEVFNHRIVWSAARLNLTLTSSEPPAGKCFSLAAMILTFFAFEGYLNWLGGLLCKDVWKKERQFFAKQPYTGTLGKLKYLREHLSLPPLNEKKRPLSTLIMLYKIRNFLAHTKPERGTREVFYKLPTFPPEYAGFLSEVITPKMANISSDDIKALANDLHKNSLSQHKDIPTAEPFCGLLKFASTEI